MKKVISILFAGLFLISLCSCNGEISDTNADLSPQSTETSANNQSAVETSAQNTTSETEAAVTAGSTEELNEIIAADISDTVAALEADYKKLEDEITTYDTYIDNTDKAEAFYTKVNEENKNLCIRLQEYAASYAEKILASDISNDDKYGEMDDLYDNIYDDGGDSVYDGIYDGVLEDMYDLFYDGVLDDGYDEVSYKEWSKARSQEYDWWSDTRSDVYEQWSDFRSDVYEFWSDIRDELWDNDVDKAEEVISDYKEDIAKLKDK